MANRYQFSNNPASGFDAVRPSTSRGEPVYPELDTRLDLTPPTRMELIRLSRWSYYNTPLVQRLFDFAAQLVVGQRGLRFRAMSSDPSWNEEAEKYFERRSSSGITWDVEGRKSFRDCCRQNVLGKWRDGERWNIKAEAESGRALFQMLPTERVRSPEKLEKFTEVKGRKWRDGVLVDKFGRAVAIGVSDEVGPSPGRQVWYRWFSPNNQRVVRRIPWDSVMHVADRLEPGRVRGLPRAASFLTHNIDRTEIHAALKHGIKAANMVAFQVVSKNGGPAQFGESLAPRRTETPGEKGDEMGSPACCESEGLPMEPVMNSGVAPILNDGREIKVVGDDRPHQNYQQFDDRIVREICLGFGLPPEILWDITGSGGANTRWLQDTTQLFLDDERQSLIDSYAGPSAMYVLARGVASGDISAGPEDWYHHAWTSPRKITVDRGRDGKIMLQELEMGMQTMQGLWGCMGEEWREQVDQWADEWAYQASAAQEAATRHGVDLSEMYAIRGLNGPPQIAQTTE